MDAKAGLGHVLVTVFVAAAGWSAVHTVDRLVDSPAIEYKISEKRIDEGSNVWEVRGRITNLSRSTSFRNATFLIARQEAKSDVRFLARDDQQQYTQIIAKAPALEVVRAGEGGNVNVAYQGASFVIPVMAPSSQFELVTRYTGSGKPMFQGSPDLGTNDAFALVEASLFTWIAKHELIVLWGFMLIWLVAIVVYNPFARYFKKMSHAS